MKKRNFLKIKSFTLVELLVVVVIIGILSTLVVVGLNGAVKKARDAKRVSDLKTIQTALYQFHSQFGRMPANYIAGQGACDAEGRNQNEYRQSMQELVDAGFLSAIPVDTKGSGYCYYDYGSGSEAGALVNTRVYSMGTSVDGFAGTCRPFAASGDNWCSKNSSQDYCLCTPY